MRQEGFIKHKGQFLSLHILDGYLETQEGWNLAAKHGIKSEVFLRGKAAYEKTHKPEGVAFERIKI